MKSLVLATIFTVSTSLGAQSDSPTTVTQPACSAAAVSCDVQALPSETTVRSFLQAIYGYDKATSFKILAVKWSSVLADTPVVVVSLEHPQRTQEFYITPDRKHAILGKVLPFGTDPFLSDRGILQTRARGPSRGAPTGDILLVEFGDLECPACKESQPLIDRIVQAHPEVRLVFEAFPLPFHPWAELAARHAQCVDKLDHKQFFDFVDEVYRRQTTITLGNAESALSEAAAAVGVPEPALQHCLSEGDEQADVEAAMQLAKDIGVTATPTLFVNGRSLLVGGMSFVQLNAIVTFEIAASRAKLNQAAVRTQQP